MWPPYMLCAAENRSDYPSLFRFDCDPDAPGHVRLSGDWPANYVWNLLWMAVCMQLMQEGTRSRADLTRRDVKRWADMTRRISQDWPYSADRSEMLARLAGDVEHNFLVTRHLLYKGPRTLQEERRLLTSLLCWVLEQFKAGLNSLRGFRKRFGRMPSLDHMLSQTFDVLDRFPDAGHYPRLDGHAIDMRIRRLVRRFGPAADTGRMMGLMLENAMESMASAPADIHKLLRKRDVLVGRGSRTLG